MKLQINTNNIEVTREKGDRWESESTLLYTIKEKLNREGHRFIKKLMWKDGHMVDDKQQYIRAAKLPVVEGDIEAIYDGRWQIRGTNEPYNKYETLKLMIARV